MSNLRTAMLKRLVLLRKLDVSCPSTWSGAKGISCKDQKQQAQQLLGQVLDTWAEGIHMLKAGIPENPPSAQHCTTVAKTTSTPTNAKVRDNSYLAFVIMAEQCFDIRFQCSCSW
jgi:hypothetical protein